MLLLLTVVDSFKHNFIVTVELCILFVFIKQLLKSQFFESNMYRIRGCFVTRKTNMLSNLPEKLLNYLNAHENCVINCYYNLLLYVVEGCDSASSYDVQHRILL